jgi:hypothetical protein
MMITVKREDSAPRPSQVIAEALVQRQGPGAITARASSLGYSQSLTRAIVCACTSTAVDPTYRVKSTPPLAAH